MFIITTPQQFNAVLNVTFMQNTNEDRVLQEYMQRGSDGYDLSIDDGRQVVQLTEQQWPSISVGTKIVMRVIEHQEEQPASKTKRYRCPRPGCNTWNDGGIDDSSIDWYTNSFKMIY